MLLRTSVGYMTPSCRGSGILRTLLSRDAAQYTSFHLMTMYTSALASSENVMQQYPLGMSSKGQLRWASTKHKVSGSKNNEKFIDKLLEAFRCYKALKPAESSVPNFYVIPEGSLEFPEHLWGLKLGSTLANMIRRGSYSKYHDEIKAMGFSLMPAPKGKPIEHILEALRCYKQLYPTVTRVPQTYKVPEGSSDFPKHLWGLQLGKILKGVIHEGSYRQHRSKIEELGFATKGAPEYHKERFQYILEALRCYRSLYPTETRIPQPYVVPMDSSAYPAHVRGLKLGKIMYNVVHRGDYGEYHDEVEQLGFLVRKEKGNVDPSSHVLEALRRFRSLHPTTRKISVTYVIPESSSDFPHYLWGMKLGKIMSNMIHRDAYRECREEAMELGFDLMVGYREQRAQNILEALRCYRSLFPKKKRVPKTFLVPHGSPDYPEHLWGLPLGNIMKGVIQRGDYNDYHDEVKKMGFELATGHHEERLQDILEALRCYKSMHPTETRVSQQYEVPEGSPDFPEHLWGMKLGRIMRNMTLRGSHSKHHGEIQAMGFDLAARPRQSEDILEALRCYKLLNPKDTRVPSSFVVPKGSSDFPEHLWGVKLGRIMDGMIRRGFYSKRRDEVEKLGFKLDHDRFPDILEALCCFKSLHPTKMNIPRPFEVPKGSSDFPEHLWGMKLGRIMDGMIHRGSYSKHRDEVEKLGFKLDSATEGTKQRFDYVLEALRCFKSLYPKKSKVPVAYVVPEGSTYFPEHLWGIKLGKIMDGMIHRGMYRKHHDAVKNIGFSLKNGKAH